MKQVTGATPLDILPAVSLDTETTGLDPTRGRIVQIGIIELDGSIIREPSAWEVIVNPGIPIPPESAQIHGIDDRAAGAASTLPELFPRFREKLGKRALVGHTIGFDLAVLEAEAARHGLDWKKPRALCVRMLATLIAPNLADHSLDALANWLSIPVRDRHTALGDARVTAEIFQALLPMLHQAGIHTLAEAERACLRLTPERERHKSAGWQYPVSTRTESMVADHPGRADLHIYRGTVGEIMNTPPVVLPESEKLEIALSTMVELGISSIFVCPSGEPFGDVSDYGIVTERDIMRKLAAHGADALEMPAGDIASRPLHSIRQSAFLYRANGRMSRLKTRHLAVRDERDRLVGAISARDLLRARTSPAIVLDDTISTATAPRELAAAWATLPAMAIQLLRDRLNASTICRIISEEIRAMTRQSAILATEAMQAEGLGPPPCAFAVLVLGSGGRGESMLIPDQDNAILFEKGEAGGSEDRWFAAMATHMSDILDKSGIPLCKGGVMARNELWRGSLDLWKERAGDWVKKSRPQDLLNIDIFFDAFAVHGNQQLFTDMMEHAYAVAHESIPFAKMLGENASNIADPFTMFGGLRGENNQLDLKKHALFPITATARALAIRHNIRGNATRERLEGLIARGVGNESELRNLASIQEFCFQLVLENQAHEIEAGRKPGNSVDLSRLDRSQTARLKEGLRQVQSIPMILRDLMFVRPGPATG